MVQGGHNRFDGRKIYNRGRRSIKKKTDPVQKNKSSDFEIRDIGSFSLDLDSQTFPQQIPCKPTTRAFFFFWVLNKQKTKKNHGSPKSISIDFDIFGFYDCP